MHNEPNKESRAKRKKETNMKKVITVTFLTLLMLSIATTSILATGEVLPDGPPPGEASSSITVHKFHDANRNGVQDPGEEDLAGWYFRIYRWDETGLYLYDEGYTGEMGTVTFIQLVPTRYKVWEEKRDCWEPTTPTGMNLWSHDERAGYYTSVWVEPEQNMRVEFGNVEVCLPPPPPSVGTGTPGYWQNHPDAWPVGEITIGGAVYAKDEAIALLKTPRKGDKTYTMFAALVAAKLNVLIGNDPSCVAGTIAAADAWMAAYGPVGSGVKAGGADSPWREGEPLYMMLDAYNNGLLCAPARD
jgi:hypothetical protein